MNNTIILMFTLMNILSDLIEFTYDCGQFTRQHILPIVVWVCLWSYDQSIILWDKMTSQEWTLKVYPTPLTTGLC